MHANDNDLVQRDKLGPEKRIVGRAESLRREDKLGPSAEIVYFSFDRSRKRGRGNSSEFRVTDIQVCLGLREFRGHQTSSAKTGEVLSKPGWLGILLLLVFLNKVKRLIICWEWEGDDGLR